MNEKQFFEKLVSTLEKMSAADREKMGFNSLMGYAENKLEELTYPE